MASWNWYNNDWSRLTKPDIIFKTTVDRIPKPKKKSHKLTKYVGNSGVKRSNNNSSAQKRANVCKTNHIIHIDL